MDFESFFSASEAAFRKEKDEILKRIDEIQRKWESSSNNDDICDMLFNDLQSLKVMLSKGHMQILRTKEEILHRKVEKSRLSFQIRQLQAEVKRFLPFTNNNIPSTDYMLCVEKSEGKNLKIQYKTSDDQIMSELSSLLDEWKQIKEKQNDTVRAEKLLREQDDEQVKNFIQSKNQLNLESLSYIDQIHKDTIHRIIIARNGYDFVVKNNERTLESLQEKNNRLDEVNSTIISRLETKLEKEKKKTEKEIYMESAYLMNMIRKTEDSNTHGKIDNKIEISGQMDKKSKLKRSIKQYKELEMKYLEEKDNIISETNQFVEKLENQMRVLMSVATAVNEPSLSRQSKTLRYVSSAISENSEVTSDFISVVTRLDSINSTLKKIIK